MTKKKERSEVEWLRSENRKMKSIIKHLKKEVGRSNKRTLVNEDLSEQLAEEMLEADQVDNAVVSANRCPNAKCKGTTELVDLGARKLIICDSCNYRQSKKV